MWVCYLHPCLPACLRPFPPAAAELERRYREGQAVYEEVMLHRPPGTHILDPLLLQQRIPLQAAVPQRSTQLSTGHGHTS